MNWFLIGTLAPFFWGITNFIDKFLMERYFKDMKVGAMLVTFAFFPPILAPILLIFAEGDMMIPIENILVLLGAGGLWSIATIPYMAGIKRADTSFIVPLFQMIPVFSLILGFVFLGETVNLQQFIGAMVIIVGAILISLDFTDKIKLPRLSVVLFLAVACFFFALSNLGIKIGFEDYDLFVAGFWLNLGYLLQWPLILMIKKYRQETFGMLREFGGKFVLISGINSSLTLIANTAFSYALVSAPLFLASVVNGSHPVFVFLMGLGLTFLVPGFVKEDVRGKVLIQKFLSIGVVVAGAIVLNLA